MLQDVIFDCSQTMVQQVLPQHMHDQWHIYHTFLLVYGACKTQNVEQLNSRIMEQWNNFCCVETWFTSQPRKYIQLPFKVGFYFYHWQCKFAKDLAHILSLPSWNEPGSLEVNVSQARYSCLSDWFNRQVLTTSVH